MKTETKYAIAILQALNELPAGRAVPEGFLYAALMGVLDLDTYYRIVGHLRAAGWVENSGAHLIRLSAKGRELLAEKEVAS